MSTATISPTELLNKTTTQPTPESKPQTTQSVNAAKVIKTLSTETPVNPQVTVMQELINTYITKIPTTQQGKDIITLFAPIVNYVFTHQDDNEVIETFRQFVAKYRNTYMSYEKALRGINTLSATRVQDRISMMYTLMYELTDPKRKKGRKFDYEYAGSVINNASCKRPNGYVAYIMSRLL